VTLVCGLALSSLRACRQHMSHVLPWLFRLHARARAQGTLAGLPTYTMVSTVPTMNPVNALRSGTWSPQGYSRDLSLTCLDISCALQLGLSVVRGTGRSTETPPLPVTMLVQTEQGRGTGRDYIWGRTWASRQADPFPLLALALLRALNCQAVRTRL
jgi:hypothetical protein